MPHRVMADLAPIAVPTGFSGNVLTSKYTVDRSDRRLRTFDSRSLHKQRHCMRTRSRTLSSGCSENIQVSRCAEPCHSGTMSRILLNYALGSPPIDEVVAIQGTREALGSISTSNQVVKHGVRDTPVQQEA